MLRIISLTEPGQVLAARIHGVFPESECWHKPKPFVAKIQQAFLAGEPLLFICATGIVVRALAPVLQDKYRDPPVLVMDEHGEYVIPLLSGHEGGANELAAQVAAKLGAQRVLTTARPYLQPVYTVGMGCERGCPADHLADLLTDCARQVGIRPDQFASVGSIALKADEQGLIALAERLGVPFTTYDVDQLSTVEPLLSQRSDYVFNTVGVYGVAESAALYAAKVQVGDTGLIELILPKQKTAKATCAIVRAYPAAE